MQVSARGRIVDGKLFSRGDGLVVDDEGDGEGGRAIRAATVGGHCGRGSCKAVKLELGVFLGGEALVTRARTLLLLWAWARRSSRNEGIYGGRKTKKTRARSFTEQLKNNREIS